MSSCIGDDLIEDFVEPEVRFLSNVSKLEVNSMFQFEVEYFDNTGQKVLVNFDWKSSDPNIISINQQGLATAVSIGKAVITASYNDGENVYFDTMEVEVGEATVVEPIERTGSLNTTSSYVLEGNFTLKEEANKLILSLDDSFKASSSLPGLYIYLSNNPSNLSNAYEVGKSSSFSGSHSYEISNIGINDFDYLVYHCKPFGVNVGHGEFSQ